MKKIVIFWAHLRLLLYIEDFKTARIPIFHQ